MFLWPACFELTRGRASGAVLAAAIFGLIHLPSPTLVAITMLAGVVWIAFYRGSGRLAPLVVSHMILATLAHGALPERLTYDMRVGIDRHRRHEAVRGAERPPDSPDQPPAQGEPGQPQALHLPAYFEAQGGTMPGFIRGLFRDIFGRPATDSDVAFWMSRKLANPRVDIANIFLASDEYAGDPRREAGSSRRPQPPGVDRSAPGRR